MYPALTERRLDKLVDLACDLEWPMNSSSKDNKKDSEQKQPAHMDLESECLYF